MKGECNVARDLMPLCIDGAASRESERYVEEHVGECEACRAYYEGMRSRLPERLIQQATEESRAFARAAARLRRRCILKRALAFLLVVVALAGGALWYFTYGQIYEREMPSSWYGVTLSRLENGSIVATLRMNRKLRPSFGGGGAREANPSAWHLYMDYFVFSSYPVDGYVVKAAVYGGSGLPDAITCGRDHVVVWRRGQDIPKASPEMEAYYQALAAFEAFEAETERQHRIAMAEAGVYSGAYRMTDEENSRRAALIEALSAAKDAVPEWGAGEEDVVLQITDKLSEQMKIRRRK